MKKISKILLVLLMLVAAAFTAIACNTSTVESISVKDEDMPVKTVYIIGSDTEFSPFGGTLTVHYSDGKEETVSLEDSKVSFSGFDPNKVGSQTITVSYEGKTCEITIRAVKRFTLVNVATDYFIGENLNRSGNLVLTKDDGTTQEVPFNDPSVILTGIDNLTATEGEKTVTVSYGGYTGELQFNVYTAAKITPSFGNTSYMSHQKQLDLSTARLTLQNQASVDGKVEGAVRKEISVTRDMLTACGINDEAIFSEARQELLERISTELNDGDYSSELFTTKQVDFKYAGQNLPFTISIYLSRPSYIMYYADKYADIDYRGVEQEDENGDTIEVIQLTEDQQNIEKVTYVAQMYFDLSDDDKVAVEEQERNDLVKLAAYHWYHKWIETVTSDELNETLSLNYSPYTGEAVLALNAGGTYDEALKLREYLAGDALKELNEINIALWQILGDEELSNLVVYTYDDINGDGVDEERTLRDFLYLAVPQEDVNLLLAQLDNAIELYESLDDVKLADVENYGNISDDVKNKVTNAYNLIISDTNQFIGNRQHYALIKLWKNDFFDILYQYYWNISQDEELEGSTAYTNAWNALVSLASYAILPSEELENFYSTAVQLLETMNLLNDQYSYDATELYYYYNLLMEYNASLKNINNELYKGLYEKIGYYFPIVSDEINNYVTVDYAMDRIDELMVTFIGISNDIPEIKEYLDFYISMYANSLETGVYEKYNEETEQTEFTEEFKKDVTKLIEDFFKLTPTYQYLFLNTISAYDVRMFDLKSYTSQQGVVTSFTGFIASYFNNVLDEDALTACDDLLYSYECYIRRMTGSTVANFDNFFEYYIHYGKEEYEALTADEQKYMQVVYDKVTELYNLYDVNQELTDMPISSLENVEWEGKFKELQKAVQDFYFSYLVIYASGIETTLPFISSKINVENIYRQFMEDLENLTDENLKAKILKFLEYGEYDILAVPTGNGNNEVETDQGNIEYILFTTFNSYRNFYVNYSYDISGNEVTPKNLFEDNEGMEEMFKDMADFIAQAQYLLLDQSWDITFDEKAGEVFQKFFAAPDESGYSMDQKQVLYTLEILGTAYTSQSAPFTMSALMYYAEELQDKNDDIVSNVLTLIPVISNYVALVESHIYYYTLLNYNPATLARFDAENLAAYNNALDASEAEYDEALSEFRTAYQGLTTANRGVFNEFFSVDSVEFFELKPTKTEA